MDFPRYKEIVASLQVGKKLPDAVYLHRALLPAIPEQLLAFIDTTARSHADDFSWNIVKLFQRDHKLTFLNYPDFDADSYPALSASLTIDLVRGTARKTNFSNSDNPPILHRKETLVPTSHPSHEQFAAITREGEEIGLYEQTRRIGFRNNWLKLIHSKGYTLVDGRLKPIQNTKPVEQPSKTIAVQRHLTAIERDKLSAPMQHLARHGYFDGDYSVLDYGCGKGHDALELETHGIDVAAWDPAHKPDGELRPSDVVNLGYVINVIDDVEERRETLRRAFRLANKLLAVSVMIGGKATIAKFQPYKDGVLSARDTFQKYFSQNEIKSFIAETLGKQGIAISPGLFFRIQRRT